MPLMCWQPSAAILRYLSSRPWPICWRCWWCILSCLATHPRPVSLSRNELMLRLDPNRYFPTDPTQRKIAAELFAAIEKLPIISPHGHTDPAWFASNAPFEDAVSLLLWPDHYLLRLLYSQGVSLESIGLAPNSGDGGAVETDRRKIWQRFASYYYIFRGTPCRAW